MKSAFLLLTTLLLSNTSFGHPEPTDSINVVPKGSTITFTRKFNIKPKTQKHLVGSNSRYACYIFLDSNAISDYDRFIPEGTVWEIDFFGFGYPRFTVSNDKVVTLFCKSATLDDNNSMTIEAFEDAISETLILKMAEAIEF